MSWSPSSLLVCPRRGPDSIWKLKSFVKINSKNQPVRDPHPCSAAHVRGEFMLQQIPQNNLSFLFFFIFLWNLSIFYFLSLIYFSVQKHPKHEAPVCPLLLILKCHPFNRMGNRDGLGGIRATESGAVSTLKQGCWNTQQWQNPPPGNNKTLTNALNKTCTTDMLFFLFLPQSRWFKMLYTPEQVLFLKNTL